MKYTKCLLAILAVGMMTEAAYLAHSAAPCPKCNEADSTIRVNCTAGCLGTHSNLSSAKVLRGYEFGGTCGVIPGTQTGCGAGIVVCDSAT